MWHASVFFLLPDVVWALPPTVCACLVNTILTFESVKPPSTSAHRQLSPYSSMLPSSLSLGFSRLFRQDRMLHKRTRYCHGGDSMAKCKTCGTEAASPRKKWVMAGRADKTGKKTQLEIGLFDCAKRKKTFRTTLSKKKI